MFSAANWMQHMVNDTRKVVANVPYIQYLLHTMPESYTSTRPRNSCGSSSLTSSYKIRARCADKLDCDLRRKGMHTAIVCTVEAKVAIQQSIQDMNKPNVAHCVMHIPTISNTNPNATMTNTSQIKLRMGNTQPTTFPLGCRYRKQSCHRVVFLL